MTIFNSYVKLPEGKWIININVGKHVTNLTNVKQG